MFSPNSPAAANDGGTLSAAAAGVLGAGLSTCAFEVCTLDELTFLLPEHDKPKIPNPAINTIERTAVNLFAIFIAFLLNCFSERQRPAFLTLNRLATR